MSKTSSKQKLDCLKGWLTSLDFNRNKNRKLKIKK